MDNQITVDGISYQLTQEQAWKVAKDLGLKHKQLSDFSAGETVKIGKFEMVVLEHKEDRTSLILKGMYKDEEEFGKNNNYKDSNADQKCREFAKELAEIIGWDNMIFHKVDLTANDGLDDYGVIQRRAALLTADTYRKFVKILDTQKPDCWWWLATPYSTEKHGSDAFSLCVAPSGRIRSGSYDGGYGVRPFLSFKSSIFESFGE